MPSSKKFRNNQRVAGVKDSVAEGFVGKVVETKFVPSKRNPDDLAEWVVVHRDGDPDYRRVGFLAEHLEKP